MIPLQIVNNMPIPENSFSFFGNKGDTIKIVNITDSTSVWKNDLILAEKFFGAAAADYLF